MPSILLENVPEPVYEELRRRAEQHKRSVDSEAMTCVEIALKDSKEEWKKWILQETDETRKRVGGYITEDEINEMKRQGRA